MVLAAGVQEEKGAPGSIPRKYSLQRKQPHALVAAQCFYSC